LENKKGTKVAIRHAAQFLPHHVGVGVNKPKTSPSFDIKPKLLLHYEDEYINKTSRHWDYFLFCWHPIEIEAEVDQSDLSQWQFIFLKSEKLPEKQKSISWSSLLTISPPIDFNELQKALG